VKFLNDTDAALFLIEVNSTHKLLEATKDYIPTDEELDTFIKKRKGVETALKDREKSNNMKDRWRRNRRSMLKGIRSFHKSTEGKRFHKRLGRFLASRITSKDENEILEYLKGVNTAKNSLITELEYFHTLTEQVELEEVVINYAIPIFNSIEEKIIKKLPLTEDEFCFLLDITEATELIRSLADKSGQSEQTVEKYWKEIKDALIRDGKSDSDDQFYGLLVSILKKKLNLT
jgi:hypothetical protein